MPKMFYVSVVAVAALGIALNHGSFDIATYSSTSEQQSDAVARWELKRLGSIAYTIDFDGSVVAPDSTANFLRTLVIDAILFGGVAILLSSRVRR